MLGASDRIARLSPHQVRVLARRLRQIAGPTSIEVPPIIALVRPEHLPLSFAQERLWVLEQIEAAGSAYNIPEGLRLSGMLDVDALERALATVVDRHEGLRTRFAVVDEAPVQVIAGAGTFRLAVEDLSDRPDEEREAEARRRVGEIARAPFDLAAGPLFRAALLKLSGEEHIAVVVMHHIVSDGWSIAVLIREVGALYAAFVDGRPSPLPALPVQYADYAVWQRGWLRGEVLARQVGYWRERLSGAPATLDLPTDRPRPAVQSFRGASISVELSKELIDGLLMVARSEGATLFMVMVAAFQVLLSRWSGQTDVVVGTPVAGRTHRQVEGLIGFFVNILALRTDLTGDPPFRSLLGQVRETALGAYAHQDLPFEKLVAELQPVRDLSRRPIFQVMINSFLEETPRSLILPGLNIGALAAEEVSARFELMLRLWETAQGAICYFEYATDLFDGTTIERLAGQFRKLLEEIVDRPEAPVSELELLGPAERCQLLEWSTSAADYLSPEYIGALAAEATLEEGAAPTELLSAMRGYVLDHWLGPAPVGVFGELYIGGVELRGSVGQPHLTAAQFLPDPFCGGARLYRTGHLARWRADGVLELVDRAERPGQAVAAAARAYEAPRTPVEEVVAGIWSEMLGVERIGVHDNFFILGGHSLLATRVIARIRDALKVELALRALFEAPSVGELAARVNAAQREGSGVAVPALVAQERPEHLPLSHAQERLWLLEQIEAAGSAYNIAGGVRLSGVLDVSALERAFAAVVERHETLRTRFAVVDGGPVQVIAGAGTFRLAVEDFSDQPDDELHALARRRAGETAGEAFDLERGPLLRAHLLRLSGEEHIAVVVMHHIVSDGWSIAVLIREVGTLYAAFVEGRPSPLPALPIQYADYALWQRGCLQGEALERQVGYWRERLSGAPAALDLPTDRPRPAVQSFKGSSTSVALSKELIDGLQTVARSEGATLFMVLVAAFQVLLSRWSGQSDVVVGTPIAGRTHRETEGLIGLFVNMLALRTDLSGDPSFRALLRRVKDVALGAYAHQDLPFEKLVAELQPVRDLSRQPIFQALLALQNVPQERLELPELTLRRMGGEHVTAKLDLSLYLQETDEGLRGHFEYATDLFEASTIERLAGHFATLLEGIVAAPDARVLELPLLGEAERHRLLSEWNATAADYPRDICVHELFADQAARTPDAVALVYEDSVLTYGELDRRANQLGHHLQELGVGSEVIVGVCAERSLEMVVGLLGTLKAGGAYLPLDPSYPAERLAYMLADAQASVLVTQARLVARMPAHAARVVQIDVDWGEIERCPATIPPNMTLPDNLAYVIYTSGSTGKPKAAANTHGGLLNRLLWMQTAYQLDESDRVLQKTPFTFDVSVWEFFWALLIGARLVVARPESHRDPAYLAELIEQQGITTLHFVPSMLQAFLQTADLRQCGSVRNTICSGEALPVDTQDRFFAKLGSRLHNLYGPTEAAIDVSYWECKPDFTGSLVPIGRPIWNTRIYVLDDDLAPLPIGVSGELYIGGAGLARGYLGRAGLTGERFIPNPHGEGERLYRTGDLARWRADGDLEFLGRLDHQVKVRGYRIELGEIEAALRGDAGVKDCVVVAREDAPGDKRLVAYVVGEGEATTDANELRARLQRSLPEYMVPSAFVRLEALPLTPNGKIDRRALPVPEGRPEVTVYEAPRNPTEEMLAAIWCELLRLDRVGVHDNFFVLGGHSLLATRVIARLREAFEVELPLRALFEAPSVEELATRVDAERRVALIMEGTAEEIADDVTKMSEEEVERMLNSFVRDAP